MPKIPAKLRLEEKFEGNIDKVQNLLDDAYLDIAPNLNRKSDMIIRNSNDTNAGVPQTSDINFDIGSFWLNTTTPALWILTDINETVSPKTAVWTSIF